MTDEPLDVEAAATAAGARELRLRLQQWLQRGNVPEALTRDLVLAAYEALANAVEHAYSQERTGSTVQLLSRLDADSIRITVSDRGRWLAPNGSSGYGGRGIQLMRQIVTQVGIEPNPDGTTVHLHARLPEATEPLSGRCSCANCGGGGYSPAQSGQPS